MMIHYSSPTLCGIKPGNLFSVKTACFSRPVFKKWEREYAELGLSVSVIEKSGITMLVLVYDRRWVQDILAESSVQTYLAAKGYRTDSEVQEIIKDLTDRIKPDTLFPPRNRNNTGISGRGCNCLREASGTAVQILRLLEKLFRCG